MPEKPTGMYNEDGLVESKNIAREMAEVEKPYHEKTLGIFPASKRKISAGEKIAEEKIETGSVLHIKDLPYNVSAAFHEIAKKYTPSTGDVFEVSEVRMVDYDNSNLRYRIFGTLQRYDPGTFTGHRTHNENVEIDIDVQEDNVVKTELLYI
jgi:hypothetical protein